MSQNNVVYMSGENKTGATWKIGEAATLNKNICDFMIFPDPNISDCY